MQLFFQMKRGDRMSRQMMTMACAVAAATTLGSLGDTIQLKRSIRLAPGVTAVTLGDVAILDGPTAQALAKTVVAEGMDTAAAQTIGVSTIRLALTAAGAHWGHIDLSGHAVAIRPAPRPAAGVPLAMSPLTINVPKVLVRGGSIATVATTETMTIAGEVAMLLAKQTGLAMDHVRVSFGKTSRDILQQSTQGRRIEIRPRSSMTGADRVAVEAIEWSDGRIIRRDAIDAHVAICIPTATATATLRRGHHLVASDFTLTDIWTTPAQAPFLAQEHDLSGRTIAIQVDEDAVIRRRDLVTPTVINRGDIVTVHCLVGSVVIRMKATAQGKASLGDTVELRRGRHEAPFLATVTGPSEARIDASINTGIPNH
jgi:flagella basal body P-ring formation protein FlgA